MTLVLFVTDLFHPVGNLAIELFLNGDMGHSCGRCGAVPVLFIRWDPNHITRTNFIYRATPALYYTATSSHDQDLA